MDESKKIGYRKLPHTMEHHLHGIIWHQESTHYLKVCMLQVHSCVSFSSISIFSHVPGCERSAVASEQMDITTCFILHKETCYKKSFPQIVSNVLKMWLQQQRPSFLSREL